MQQAANFLSEVEQSPMPSMLDSMKPCLNAIAKQELLKHQDRDVKVLVATCICEIMRITAPEAPFGDDVLRVTLTEKNYINSFRRKGTKRKEMTFYGEL